MYYTFMIMSMIRLMQKQKKTIDKHQYMVVRNIVASFEKEGSVEEAYLVSKAKRKLTFVHLAKNKSYGVSQAR